VTGIATPAASRTTALATGDAGGAAALLASADWDAITGRPPFVVDAAAVAGRVRGRAVLVTGAAGSLGAPLAHALGAVAPGRLVLVDQHESSLFRLREAIGVAHPRLSLRAALGDVRSEPWLRRLCQAERPNLLFHLAAYKHVPWAEEDPEAYASNNVLGAQATIAACRATGVDQIVYPSTDKAVDPPSLYGATKRLVEAMLQAAAQAGGPRCTIVRFVNVLGSQGSTTETFARQIAAGRPLSVTDPAMRRYWITPDHARLLLLHGACLPDRAAVIAPDAGDEITTLEIARRMSRALRPLAGAAAVTSAARGGPAGPNSPPAAAEGVEPEIAITGIRPGERLAEPLCAPGEVLETLPLPGVLRVRPAASSDGAAASLEQVESVVQAIAAVLECGADGSAIRAAVFAAARAVPAGTR
jgi:O-antigen biosynthesis protein WbqV